MQNDEKIIWFSNKFSQLRSLIERDFIGKPLVVDYVLFSLIGNLHILLEDVPGVGKTKLAMSLAKCINGNFSRIQFTPDLMPTDILGINIYQKENMSFKFHNGPIFTNILLADEINRASSKTASALLEAMAEKSVTIDGVTHKLPEPFIVIATQNPIESEGTYNLPEAALDRFGIKTSIGYLGRIDAMRLLMDVRYNENTGINTTFSNELKDTAKNDECKMELSEITKMQEMVRMVSVKPVVIEYILDIIQNTRNDSRISFGVSERGAMILTELCRVRALVHNREYVIPDDVIHLAGVTLSHRIVISDDAEFDDKTANDIINDIVNKVEVPEF